MNQAQIMKTAFFISITLILMGTTLKIMHLQGSSVIVLFAVISAVVWTILALIEIWSSRRLEFNVKLMWTVGFFVFNVLAGILYFLIGRQRVIGQESPYKSPLTN